MNEISEIPGETCNLTVYPGPADSALDELFSGWASGKQGSSTRLYLAREPTSQQLVSAVCGLVSVYGVDFLKKDLGVVLKQLLNSESGKEIDLGIFYSAVRLIQLTDFNTEAKVSEYDHPGYFYSEVVETAIYYKAFEYARGVLDNHADQLGELSVDLLSAYLHSRDGRLDESLALYQKHLEKLPMKFKIFYAWTLSSTSERANQMTALQMCTELPSSCLNSNRLKYKIMTKLQMPYKIEVLADAKWTIQDVLPFSKISSALKRKIRSLNA